jgi:hypothetical protein
MGAPYLDPLTHMLTFFFLGLTLVYTHDGALLL